MKGSRPEQAALTRDTDLSKTDATRAVIEGMVDGLNDHRIADIGEFFAQSFRWMGNTGCGTKQGLKEFQDNYLNNANIKESFIYLLDHLELLFPPFDAKVVDLRNPPSDAKAQNL